MAVDCAGCKSYVCQIGRTDSIPENCPMRGELPDFNQLYSPAQWREMAYHAAVVEAEGYGRWPRVKEIAEIGRRMGYRRIGIGHCYDMGREARLASDYLSQYGFQAVLPAEGDCDPEGQARFFEKHGTELNVICGMCVGHDSIFIRSSSAPVTSLVVRDVKLRHNPVAALYTSESYFKDSLYRNHRREHLPLGTGSRDTETIDSVSRTIVREGRGQWCRVEETVELAYRLGAVRLGIVYCSGFRSEARTLKRILAAHGFEVSSSCCKTGCVPKEALGISDSQKVRPGTPEMVCNPIGQAALLNRENVQLVLLLGQCVGHDSATMAHLEPPAICVVTKDRALAHNSVASLYALENST